MRHPVRHPQRPRLSKQTKTWYFETRCPTCGTLVGRRQAMKPIARDFHNWHTQLEADCPERDEQECLEGIIAHVDAVRVDPSSG